MKILWRVLRRRCLRCGGKKEKHEDCYHCLPRLCHVCGKTVNYMRAYSAGLEKGEVMNVGFTGTKHGLTWAQRCRVIAILRTFEPSRNTFHHGDCVGADAMAHDLARREGYQIVRHPPLNPQYRAFCNEGVQRKLKRYLDRNHDIVDESDVLIACPHQAREVMRSGTWATVRYAKKKGKPVILVLPSGEGGYEANN